ncbi:hypothetical protein MMC30_001641 [Trapelia coarctata]|nr:hypothetical protein [Trapelia coarctata]
MATLRSSARTLQQQFTATAPKYQHIRRLHITESMATPSKLLTSEPATTQSPRESKPTDVRRSTRTFNTTRALKTPNDTSTIDFAYMPQYELSTDPAPEIARIPLLPNNYESPRRSVAHQEAIEPVIRPMIETASADSDGVVSAMSEVTDNHAMDIDMYDLTRTVGKAAKGLGKEQVGAMKELWTGFVDDLLGKKIAKG